MSRLLTEFEETFRGKAYLHRVSTHGDRIGSFLYEDLYEHCLTHDPKNPFLLKVQSGAVVLNQSNKVTGKKGRRPDGMMGERVPVSPAESVAGLHIPRAPVATVQIGAEFKIMATKMTAQMERVATDMINQANVIKDLGPTAIRIGFLAVNHASSYLGREGDRRYPSKTAPLAASQTVIKYVSERAKPLYDELILLTYSATNDEPFPFAWVNAQKVKGEYSAAVLRIAGEYRKRFP